MEQIEKLYNEYGQVAVAVSYGYGAGWSTWNSNVSPLDKEFNELFLANDWDKVKELAKSRNLYAGGMEDVEIEWVEPGTKFKITEYDGYESLELLGDIDWYEA